MTRAGFGTCVTCGAVDTILTRSGLCPSCQRARHLEKARVANLRSYYKRKAEGKPTHYHQPTGNPRGRPPQTPKPWIVLEDTLPVEQGGFRPGAELGKHDIYYALIEGALKTGMRLKSPDGVEYTVMYGYLYDAGGRLHELKK